MNLRLQTVIEEKRCNTCHRVIPKRDSRFHIVRDQDGWIEPISGEECHECKHFTDVHMGITHYYLIQNLSYLYNIDHKNHDVVRTLISSMHHRYLIMGVIVAHDNNPYNMKKYLDNPDLLFTNGWVTKEDETVILLPVYEYTQLHKAVQIARGKPVWR